MTSDGTKQGENVKFELVPAFVFFPLEWPSYISYCFIFMCIIYLLDIQ